MLYDGIAESCSRLSPILGLRRVFPVNSSDMARSPAGSVAIGTVARITKHLKTLQILPRVNTCFMSIAPCNDYCVVAGKLNVTQLRLTRNRQGEETLALVLFLLVQAGGAGAACAKKLSRKNRRPAITPGDCEFVWRGAFYSGRFHAHAGYTVCRFPGSFLSSARNSLRIERIVG